MSLYYLYISHTSYIYLSLGLSILFSMILTFFIVKKNNKFIDILNFCLLPLTLTCSLYASSMLIIRSFVVWLGLILILILSYYFKQVYIYNNKTREYKIGTLENFSSNDNLISFALFSFAMYGFRTELNTSNWIVLPILALFSAISIYQLFWAHKLEFREMLPTLLVTIITLTEIAWAINLLPFDYLSTGILLSIIFYAFTNISKHFLLKKIDTKKVHYYLTFVVITYILIFLSVRWL